MENPKKRLGFREIVPGSDATVPTSPSFQEVPQLDLGQQLMANHRKLVAATRRRSGQKDQASEQAGSQSAVGPVVSERVWRPVMTEPQSGQKFHKMRG